MQGGIHGKGGLIYGRRYVMELIGVTWMGICWAVLN